MSGHCERCGKRLSTSDAVERRVEYRRLRDLKRLRTWRVELVCGSCTAADIAEHRGEEMRRKHPGLYSTEPLGVQQGFAFEDGARR
jgi:hypothetical protein